MDKQEPLDLKKWLQIVGGSLVGAGILNPRTTHPRNPRIILAGVLIFLASFLTWKPDVPKDSDDDMDSDIDSKTSKKM